MMKNDQFQEFLAANVMHFRRIAQQLMTSALARADDHIARYPTRADFSNDVRTRALREMELWKKEESDVKLLVTYIAEMRDAQLGTEVALAGFYFVGVVEEEVCRHRKILTDERLNQLIDMYRRACLMTFNQCNVRRGGDNFSAAHDTKFT